MKPTLRLRTFLNAAACSLKSAHFNPSAQNAPLSCRTSGIFFAGFAAVGLATSVSAQTVIGRANNATAFNANGAWTGGVAPTSSQIVGFSSINTATSGTSTIDAAVNFQIAGITYTSNPGTNLQISGGAGSLLTIGASGIDASGGTRVLTINATAPVVLSANQTWTTGTAADSTSQIVVNSVVSGSGSLTINGTSGSPLSPVYLNNLNTFTGGVTLNSGASLRFGGGTPTYSGNLTTSSSIGTGNLTINGGTIFGTGGTLAASTTTINGNVAINHATSSLNGRFTIAGGTLDLAGGTRTVSTGRFNTAANALTGGNESLRFLQTVGAPIISVTNGNLRFVRGSTGSATDFVGVSFGSGSNFAAGSGLTIGENVITTMATGNPFGVTAGAQPQVTVESGGYFNMSDAANARAPQIRSLSGSGTVTSLANSATPATATLTINSQAGDDTTFSGAIVTGSSLNGALGTSATNVAVAVSKTGAGIQRFSGSNSYTGATNISGGILVFANTAAKSSGTTVTATAAGTVGLGVGGSGYYGETDVANLFNTNSLSGFNLNAASGVAIDTTNAAGGSFDQTTGLTAARALTKLGTGTLILSGAHSYTGATNVNHGKLVVNGNISTSSLTTVASGTTLGGAGTIGKTVINGTLAVGNSPGTMAFTDTLGLNGSTIMEIDGNSGAGVTGGHDFVNLTGSGAAGALTYGGTMTLDIGVIFGIGTYSWNLFDMASETGTFTTISLADQYSGSLVNTSGVWDLTSGINTWQFTESTGVLGLTVVPEPNLAMLVGGLGMLALLRRRRM